MFFEEISQLEHVHGSNGHNGWKFNFLISFSNENIYGIVLTFLTTNLLGLK